MPDLFGFDAFAPREIAARIEAIGVTKARLPLLSTLMLAVLAGAFIGLGALNFMLVRSDPTLGFAARQLGGGVAFSLGLILVVVAGAELFTGNNLLVMAWADRKITTAEVLRNWVLVCAGNFVGAAGLAVLVYLSGHTAMNNGLVAEQIVRIASAKCAMPLQEAFLKGVLCNLLVCMAVWMATAGRGVIDKVVAIVFPISAFVAAGFEHSIANFYLIPLGMLLQSLDGVGQALPAITWAGFAHNGLPVILGNLVGGAVLVGLVYHVIYQRSAGVRSLPHEAAKGSEPARTEST
ncbi:MAG: formate/nitrite transporter family protein [Burkholderiaceae bacterium]|nr:formate/nitrite transporter family protein [Burkholderiaceae bacterium]